MALINAVDVPDIQPTIAESLDSAIAAINAAEAQVEQFEASLSAAKAIREDAYNRATGMMKELGLSDLTTGEGVHATVKRHWNVAVKDKAALALWLTANGYGSAIRTEMSFQKGEDVSSVIQTATLLGIEVEVDERVHPQTLKKLMKDHSEAGLLPPPEGTALVTSFDRVEITRKEAK